MSLKKLLKDLEFCQRKSLIKRKRLSTSPFFNRSSPTTPFLRI